MHEASIAASIIDVARKECEKAGYSIIRNIEVDIGAASGVLPDALLMAFDIVKLDSPAAEADLKINSIPLGGTCRSCSRAFTTEDQFILECPHCSSRDFSLETGRELNIREIEVD